MKPFTVIAIVIFSLMSIVHILRLIYGWEVVINGSQIPVWMSAVAAVVLAVIAYMLWRESSKDE
jgi:type VI protein secretion system component VasF